MADNNQNNQYTLPPDLSSILAALAQNAPQSTTPANHAIQDISFLNGNGQQYPNQPQYPHLHPQTPHQPQQQSDEVSAILAAVAAQAQPHSPPNMSTLPSQPLFDLIQHGTASQPPPQDYNSLTPSQQLERPWERPLDPRSRSLDPRRGGTIPKSPAPTPQTGPIIDPATITVWSEGLRCVNKIAVQNRDFAAQIKRMISNQQKHEMQWYSGRQELKQTQARRQSGLESINSIFGSLSGHPISASITSGFTSGGLEKASREEENAAELKAFDMKVYKAQLAMHDSMEMELKALGVPFFGTKEDRIVREDEGTQEFGSGGGGDGEARWSPRITKKELLGLKKRMVQFLEDMYKE